MAKRPNEESSLREHFAWTYGTLAMVHYAVAERKTKYERVHFIIRGRFRNGYPGREDKDAPP